METEESENSDVLTHNLHVTSLDLSYDASLTDISFIWHFPNLVKLNLEENRNLGNNYHPVSNLKNLTKLNLNYMRISDLTPLLGLQNLTWLEITDGDITLLELKNLGI
jgi:Leucine-rich repeat (LRR) protein